MRDSRISEFGNVRASRRCRCCVRLALPGERVRSLYKFPSVFVGWRLGGSALACSMHRRSAPPVVPSPSGKRVRTNVLDKKARACYNVFVTRG